MKEFIKSAYEYSNSGNEIKNVLSNNEFTQPQFTSEKLKNAETDDVTKKHLKKKVLSVICSIAVMTSLLTAYQKPSLNQIALTNQEQEYLKNVESFLLAGMYEEVRELLFESLQFEQIANKVSPGGENSNQILLDTMTISPGISGYGMFLEKKFQQEYVYLGNFQDGLFAGEGIYYLTSQTNHYSYTKGEWSQGYPNGYGEYVFFWVEEITNLFERDMKTGYLIDGWFEGKVAAVSERSDGEHRYTYYVKDRAVQESENITILFQDGEKQIEITSDNLFGIAIFNELTLLSSDLYLP